MSGHVCISVTFLDPLFHGQGDDYPEWPPSPMRLFQALLAGARTGCRSQEWSPAKAEAFRWLERSPPPLIVAPAGRPVSAYTLFVPNNDSDRKFIREDRLTTKVFRRHLLQNGDTVHYLWTIEENEGPATGLHARQLCLEARHLLALGWGIDQVVGNGRILTSSEVAALRGERWRPWKGHWPATRAWRVPKAGSLDDLERVHGTFVNRVDGKKYDPTLNVTQFDTVSYFRTGREIPSGAGVDKAAEDPALPPRSYAAFDLAEGVAFRREDVAKVGAMLRSLTSRCASADTHEFPGGSGVYVAGHTGSAERTPPRFSYLPLPTIGHQHADGMIRRLLVAEPFGGDGNHALWAQHRLRNMALHDDKGSQRGILLDLWRPTSKTVVQRYVSSAQAWSTVTPVVLPGFDDGKHTKAERLLVSAIRHAGVPIDALAELVMRKAPFWPGAEHPRSYFVPAYLEHFPSWHVRLVFNAPVPGPLVIGAGRHAGLGIFAHEGD